MAKYQKYAEYKDSGTDWLGEIPTHWDVQPTKRFFRLIAEPAPENNDYELLSVYTEIGVKPRKELEQKGNKASTTDGYWLVKKGDIVVNKLLAWMGAVGYSEYDGVTSPAYDILRPTKKLNPKFYHYLFRTKIANMEFKRWSRGIMEMRLRLYFDELGRIAMPFPTFKEQNEIVNFLDHETAKIDSLIAKQEKLIELLKEKRQAVISHAVTKGLNPNVAMKDSGVEWLGQVPEHWTVKPNKYLLDFVTSGSRGWAQFYADTGSLFFRIANLTRDTIEPKLESLQFVEPPQGSEGERSKIKIGDLLISITADLGSVCVADSSIQNGYVSQHVALCRPQKLYNSRWLAYYILSDSAKEQLLGSGYGGTKIQLSLEDIKELVIAVPPKEEQILIANYIDEKLNQFEHLIKQANKLVMTLQERRTALISSAVTGKIDLRNWQHPNEAKTELNL